jgi:hypothetical protein
MVADALTKSLPAPGLARRRSVMTGHSTFYARMLHVISGGYGGLAQQFNLDTRCLLYGLAQQSVPTCLFPQGESDYLSQE